jgi:hypothetical protein
MTEYPRRAHELIVKIGADTREALVAEIENFARRVARDDVTRGIMGGSDAGSIYSYQHDPNQTHDEYFRQLNEILERERGKKS